MANEAGNEYQNSMKPEFETNITHKIDPDSQFANDVDTHGFSESNGNGNDVDAHNGNGNGNDNCQDDPDANNIGNNNGNDQANDQDGPAYDEDGNVIASNGGADNDNYQSDSQDNNGTGVANAGDSGASNNGGGNTANNSQMEPEQFRKVFIGGLSYKTDDETLKTYFSKFGELVDYVVMKDSQSGRSRGFGFVTYSYSSMVDELMKNRPHIIDGRQVEPKRATPREDSGKSEVQMTVKKLFIGGLRDNLSEDDLKTYFGLYGNVVEAVVMKEKETNKSRGFGFVTFDDYDPVDKIILEKHHSINGVNIHTQKALPKDYEKGQGGMGGGGPRQGNFRNDNQYGNNNFNGNNYNGGGPGGYNNYQPRNQGQFQMQPRNNNPYHNNNQGGGGSSMNNTYGSYNQAPNKPRIMSDGGMGSPVGNMPMMGGNQMGNNNRGRGGGGGGGPGPMRGGHGRFMNRSAGPYGGGGGGGPSGGFNNGNNNNFNNNRGRIGGGRGIGQRGTGPRDMNMNMNMNN